MTDSDTEVRTIPPDTDPAEERAFAIAVRIGDRSLWVGNQWATESEYYQEMDLELSHVVALNSRPGEETTDHHEIRDGRINNPELFAKAVDVARKRYRQDGSVMISCAAGISRSATVAATILSAEENMNFDAAVAEIQKHRKRADPHPKLKVNGLYYLLKETNRETVKPNIESMLDNMKVNENDADDIPADIFG